MNTPKEFPHWNGMRYVSQAEWEIAEHIVKYAEYSNLPWYKRMFKRKPKRV